MKQYRLIYVPIGKEDKEWIIINASSIQEALVQADQMGDIIDLIEETE